MLALYPNSSGYNFIRNCELRIANWFNPLPHTAIIVDEASMLDLFLAYSLAKAVDIGAQAMRFC
ncbi:hypothetical protein LC613_34435 [Nostoc sphaeroides CHAB 2801]|nr:hypothetical protein [Nostoc sphaeroides]MCC5632696.1 hypothetical protein [Nostoc sphaeroides CHAB 2801]